MSVFRFNKDSNSFQKLSSCSFKVEGDRIIQED